MTEPSAAAIRKEKRRVKVALRQMIFWEYHEDELLEATVHDLVMTDLRAGTYEIGSSAESAHRGRYTAELRWLLR